jgi:hypothetical protein
MVLTNIKLVLNSSLFGSVNCGLKVAVVGGFAAPSSMLLPAAAPLPFLLPSDPPKFLIEALNPPLSLPFPLSELVLLLLLLLLMDVEVLDLPTVSGERVPLESA